MDTELRMDRAGRVMTAEVRIAEAGVETPLGARALWQAHSRASFHDALDAEAAIEEA